MYSECGQVVFIAPQCKCGVATLPYCILTCQRTACHVEGCSKDPWADNAVKRVCAALFLIAECSLTQRSDKQVNNNIHTASNTGNELWGNDWRNSDDDIVTFSVVFLRDSISSWTVDWCWFK